MKNRKKKKDISSRFTEATDILSTVAILTLIATVGILILLGVVSIGCEIASKATEEVIAEEVCEVEVVETQISSYFQRGVGEKESYYVTIRGNSFSDVVETDKDTYLSCLGKETIEVKVVKTIDCFNRTKQTVTI